MNRLYLRPLLGLKTDVPADDISLFRFLTEEVCLTRDTGGLNIDYRRKMNACSKAMGYSAWSNSAVGTPARCHGLFELYDGTNRNNLLFEKGRVFYFDGSKDPQQLNNALLNYDGQTGDFTPGLTITGTDSSATGVIVEDADAGESGTLSL